MENFNAKEYEEKLRIEAKVRKEIREEYFHEAARIALGVILGHILWSMGEYLLSL